MRVVWLTGSTGFIGKYVKAELEKRNFLAYTPKVDLLDCDEVYKEVGASIRKLDGVIHLAGVNGGLAYQSNNLGIFLNNSVMAMNLMGVLNLFADEATYLKVVSAVASCAYPELDDWDRVPMSILKEETFLYGPPHPSVVGHAYAKRNVQVVSTLLSQANPNIEAVTVCPTTVYGPGMCYDPQKAKVMGGIMGKIFSARMHKLPSVELWGNGEDYREFIHVNDCARLIVDAYEKYTDTTSPLNLGTGQELTINALAHLIKEKFEYKGDIIFGGQHSNAAKRKRLDLYKMERVLGPQQFIPLADGISRCFADLIHQHSEAYA